MTNKRITEKIDDYLNCDGEYINESNMKNQIKEFLKDAKNKGISQLKKEAEKFVDIAKKKGIEKKILTFLNKHFKSNIKSLDKVIKGSIDEETIDENKILKRVYNTIMVGAGITGIYNFISLVLQVGTEEFDPTSTVAKLAISYFIVMAMGLIKSHDNPNP